VSERSARPEGLAGEARPSRGRLASAALTALSIAYSGALHLHLLGYRIGLARRTKLPATVISIGNLTVGGTGKTTAAMAVAQWLWERGRRVALLSRGYRGKAEGGALVVSEGFGPLVDPDTAGDEPYMVAHKLPNVYVFVGKDRRRTGRLAVHKYGLNALVLDDGFQYQRLHRDLDIVLVDALRPFGYHLLVPAGLLREPPEHLERAHAVWMTHCDLVRREDLEQTRARVMALAPHAHLWESVHAPARLKNLAGEEELKAADLHGRRVCALSALGNPLAFERTLARLGADLVSHARFPDHYPYRAEELAEVARGQAAEAEWIVTTEKDAVRLPREKVGKPVWVLEVVLAGRAGDSAVGEEMACLLGGMGGI